MPEYWCAVHVSVVILWFDITAVVYVCVVVAVVVVGYLYTLEHGS